MKRIDSAVQAYQENLRTYIQEEIQINGGSFQRWYDDLLPFRKYIEKNFVLMRLGKEMYVYRPRVNKYRDYIDHHIISYLAPLDYKRIGWNCKNQTPCEQIGEVSSYLTDGGGGDL